MMVVIYDPAPPQVLTGGKLENHWKHYWKFNIFVQIHVRRQLFGCSNNVDVVDEKKTKDRDVRLSKTCGRRTRGDAVCSDIIS